MYSEPGTEPASRENIFERKIVMSHLVISAPDSSEHAPYYSKYISLVQGNDVNTALSQQLDTTLPYLRSIPTSKADFRYAPDKWSVKQVIGHVNDAERFYTSTYPVISSGKKSQVIMTSTMNGVGNLFYRLWQGAVQGANEYKPFRVDWWDVPGRDEKWKRETIANTSQLQFDQEYGNCLSYNSQIHISINSNRYDIRIGDLYSCLSREETGHSSGLSLEEKIRRKAIRGYHD